MNLDPHDAALWALVAISLVLVGAILTAGVVSVEQRGATLGAITAVLFAVGWRIRRRGG